MMRHLFFKESRLDIKSKKRFINLFIVSALLTTLIIGSLDLRGGVYADSGSDQDEVKWSQVICEGDATVAKAADGGLWVWGYQYSYITCFGKLGDCTRPIKILNNVKQFAVSEYHAGALKTDGSLWMWGRNDDGQLGDRTKTDRELPVKVMDSVEKLYIGDKMTAVIKTDGSLWIWGNNDEGWIGDGTYKAKSTPVKIMDGVKDVVLPDAGGYGACTVALKTDNTVWVWGDNSYGTVGDGTTENRSTPVKVLTSVKSIASGSTYIAAIKTDDSLWMWGSNSQGQLGDGTETDCAEPKKILDDVKSVTCEKYHTGAIKTDGTLWAWGSNYDGELGIGVNSDKELTPIEIMSQVKSVSYDYRHSSILCTDGRLLMCGDNGNGVIGDGTYDNTNTYKPIMESVVNYTLAGFGVGTVDLEGNLWRWGYGGENYTCDDVGLIGDGSVKETKPYPVRIVTQNSEKTAPEIIDEEQKKADAEAKKKAEEEAARKAAELKKNGVLDSKLPKVSIAKASKSKKSIKVKIKKISKKNLKKIDGFEVQYSLNKQFTKAAALKSVKKTKSSVTIKKLKSKKTYFVRVRTYKKVKGIKHFSKWSKVKKIKTK